MKVDTKHVVAGVFVAVGAGVAYLATRTVGNTPQPKYTEEVIAPLQVQAVSLDNLNMSRTFTHPHWPVRYPTQVAAGVSRLINLGFAPHWQPGDPQIAALPAEDTP